MVVVGNLPYYITSPLLRMRLQDGAAPLPLGGVFLIQKEVAEKLLSTSRKKSFLRRCITNWYDVSLEMIVPPQAFNPPPKVDSAIIICTRREKPRLTAAQHTRALEFLDLVSTYKRKTLGKIQKIIDDARQIPPHLHAYRVEQLDRTTIAEVI